MPPCYGCRVLSIQSRTRPNPVRHPKEAPALKLQTIFISLLALAGVAAPAGATTVTYTNLSALESANSDLTFTNISFSAYFGQSGLTSVTAGGVTFTDSV